MTKDRLEELRLALKGVSKEERRDVFQFLRQEFPIHALEKEWNASAELILEAIARASDLTRRGIRGVIAEAAFEQSVALPLIDKGWKVEIPEGDHPFDFLLVDKDGPVKVQVKMQRLEKKVPKLWKSTRGVFVVETQKTRSGKDSSGKATREAPRAFALLANAETLRTIPSKSPIVVLIWARATFIAAPV